MEHMDESRQLAERILSSSRRALAADFPPLMPAIYCMAWSESKEPCRMYSDGTRIYYNAQTVVSDYRGDRRSIAGQLLHIVLHGLLGHFSKRPAFRPELFDAAADIKVAQLMAQLGYGKAAHTGAAAEKQKNLTLEALMLLPKNPQEEQQLLSKAQSLTSDCHSQWGKASGALRAGNTAELWNYLCGGVLNTVRCAKKYGSLAGILEDCLQPEQGSRTDYRTLLRKYFHLAEDATASPESISRIWYHYGQELGLVMVEPDETQEDAPVLSLAVAIDTSGSCYGQAAAAFLRELAGVLHGMQGVQLSLTVIECDCKLQKIWSLNSSEAFALLGQDFPILGGGGTSFVPVFEYLAKQPEVPQVLLYFTDGFGEFPAQAPDYPVVFLLPQGAAAEAALPPWIEAAEFAPGANGI